MTQDTEFVTVQGTRLELRRLPGAGLPILLLHEGLGCIAMWRDFPDQLAAATGRPVIIWSRPGFGHSDPAPGARGTDYLHRETDDALALMDALDIPTAHFFGHSDGASITLIAAATAPDRVASLIVEAPHVIVEEISLAGIRQARTLYDTTDLGAKLGRYHADVDRVFRRWSDIWLDPVFRDWSIEDLLPRITAPALLVQGKDDEYGSLDQLDRIERAVPHAQRLVLDPCGHSPHREQARAVLDATVAFLRPLP